MPRLEDFENPTEDQECEAFSQWLTLKKIPHTHIGNESGRGRAAMLRTAKLKRMGQSAGFPDYLVVIIGSFIVQGVGEISEIYLPRLVAIEMKRKKGGRVSEAQQEWIDILNSAGVETVVCKGFDEAKQFIEERIK